MSQIVTGFVYLAAILDAWSRRVVGYAISRSMDRDFRPSWSNIPPHHTLSNVGLLPTKFEFVLNCKTSKVRGLDVSPLLQQRADEMIEWGGSLHCMSRVLASTTGGLLRLPQSILLRADEVIE
jgi:hypothetical protein